MNVDGITLTADQEAEFNDLAKDLASELGDDDLTRRFAEELWLLYHYVAGDQYVELRPEDEVDEQDGNARASANSSGPASSLPVPVSDAYKDYLASLNASLHAYRAERFAGRDHLFEQHGQSSPPVFARNRAHLNSITRPGAEPAEAARVWKAVSPAKHHRWFRSMASSQALAQSVFANLIEYRKLDLLEEIVDEDHMPIFLPREKQNRRVELEHEIDYLREPRRTSVDVLFNGTPRIAVECKLTEREVGACSRPTLKLEAREFCNGNYTTQKGRISRCSLAEDGTGRGKGVAYWEVIPELFNWERDEDRNPCPLRYTYQLVRNVLAACVRPDGKGHFRQDPTYGHAVLLFDARNPAFHAGGEGRRAYDHVRDALKQNYASAIRPCTWQQVIRVIKNDKDVAWLAKELRAKYGF